MALAPKTISRNQIKIYGVSGQFSVRPPADDQGVKVRYFQTVASHKSSAAGGQALELLKELKPMRERVRSADLKDLRSLLQRDLSDYRVAHQLVPYLEGKNSPVGFFPSILVALIPKGFLEGKNDTPYPEPNTSPDGLTESYDNNWDLERYPDEKGTPTTMGQLAIDPARTDLIVLDGQHRANAFRFVAGQFPEATSPESIYSVFYRDCQRIDPDDFDAELPVTIVWFESASKVTPNLISRRLFVDVNTNATKVSESRNILLDDTHPGCLATIGFYELLSQNGFESSAKLSLLHGGFDCDGSFPAGFPKTAFTCPANINYALNYFLLAQPHYRNIGYTISADFVAQLGNYNERIKDLCSQSKERINDNILSNVKNGDADSINLLISVYKKEVLSPIKTALEDFGFLKEHLHACSDLESIIKENGTSEWYSVWDKAFKGGEGLYTAFLNASRDPELESNLAVQRYKRAADEINDKLASLRQDINSHYNSALFTFTSMAGLTGYLMAIDFYSKIKGWKGQETINEFLDIVNKYSTDQWCKILTTYKQKVIKENQPRLWTNMREIYLRFIDDKADLKIFDNNAYADHHPDFIFCRKILESKFNNYIQENEEFNPSEDTLKNWVTDAVEDLNTCLYHIGATVANPEALTLRCNSLLQSKITEIAP